jgi:uncharacterized protein YjbJ (UPF0337 family)
MGTFRALAVDISHASMPPGSMRSVSRTHAPVTRHGLYGLLENLTPFGGLAMNWDTVKGDWKQFSGKVKAQWGKLTDDELTQINGNREQLEGKIQARYGYAKDKAKTEVDNWLNRP